MPLTWMAPLKDTSAVLNGKGRVGQPGTCTGVLAATAVTNTTWSNFMMGRRVKDNKIVWVPDGRSRG